MAQSTNLSAGDTVIVDQYNLLRSDVLSTTVGHTHAGTADSGAPVWTIRSGSASSLPGSPNPGDVYLATDTNVIYHCVQAGTWSQNLYRPPNSILGLYMPAPTGVAASATTGGSLAPGTYYYKVVGEDLFGGLTLPSAEVAVTVSSPNNAVLVTWTDAIDKYRYRVYGRSGPGGQNMYWIAPGTAYSFMDTGAAGTSGTPPGTPSAYAVKMSSNPNAEAPVYVSKGYVNLGNAVGSSGYLERGISIAVQSPYEAFITSHSLRLVITVNNAAAGGNALYITHNGAEPHVGVGWPAEAIIQVLQNSPTDPIADAWTTYASSERFKRDISPIGDALERVKRLVGVSFVDERHVTPEGVSIKRHRPIVHELGFTVENLGDVVPEAISYDDEGQPFGMDITRVIPILVEAVKQQQNMIEELQSRLASIQAQGGPGTGPTPAPA